MKSLYELLRPNIRDLKPYSSARDEFSGEAAVFMDANENPFNDPYNRYPDPYQRALKKKIGTIKNVDPANIFLGNGSDEAIDIAIRAFCRPGIDNMVSITPTYGMYKVAANINNVDVQEVLLTEKFQLQPDAIIEEANENSKLLFLCSPNNPTANDLKRTDLLKLVAKFKGIVVVDEAYIDFSRQESMAQMVQQYPNLVVLQTFSKAFGLAGIRLGIAISNPDIINYMLRVKAPYNINKLTADTALKAFENMELMKFNINAIKEERDYVAEQLSLSSAVTKVYPSNANFILFKIENAKEVYQQLAERGVIVRYRGNEPLCEDCLRVTIGMPDENVKFLKALKEIVG